MKSPCTNASCMEGSCALQGGGQGLALTGDDAAHSQLWPRLLAGLARAERIDIVVAFLMESGVRMMAGPLREALRRGVAVRILTGSYLGITEPSALFLVRRELAGAELHLYDDRSRSFHPKAYICHHREGGELFIGSSNISRSALTRGIEWNYCLQERLDPTSFARFAATFEDLVAHHSLTVTDTVLKDYAARWTRPSLAFDLAVPEPEREVFAPRGIQVEALYALQATREDGADRALVQAATGIGKTAIAAFDSAPFSRVLFIAHRREILEQAARTFARVRPDGMDGIGFVDGARRQTDRPVVMASVATIGRQGFLETGVFPPGHFDYVVIDEFHHAVNDAYLRVISHFRPKFLLGLTATPERLDGRSIYALCRYNVPYSIDLFTAVGKGLLSPFRYFGIYDGTVDYGAVRMVRGSYDERDLNRLYLDNSLRYDLIHRHFLKHAPRRTLGFCCSREHAEAMAQAFRDRGVRACAVYSGSPGPCAQNRDEALEALRQGAMEVVFSVDMFNEGVDVPSVDCVLFLRPTESPTVFFQQLGRGLRTSPGKEYLTVLDFLGNYRTLARVPEFLEELTGRGPAEGDGRGRRTRAVPPRGCIVDLDLRVIDVIEEMRRRRLDAKGRVRAEFERIREALGHVPSRYELFCEMEDSLFGLCQSSTAANPFRDYLAYLDGLNLLDADERALLAGPGHELVRLMETTAMTKVYKMPVLEALANQGRPRLRATKGELLRFWKAFFDTADNWRDLASSRERYRAVTDAQHLATILRNPVHFLIRSGKGLLQRPLAPCGSGMDEAVIGFAPHVEGVLGNPALARHMEDVLRVRTTIYYRTRRLVGSESPRKD